MLFRCRIDNIDFVGVNRRHTIAKNSARRLVETSAHKKFRQDLIMLFQIEWQGKKPLPISDENTVCLAFGMKNRKMDIDAMIKAVLDALTEAGVICDDRDIMHLDVDKEKFSHNYLQVLIK